MQIGIRSAHFLLKSTFSASPIGAGWSICIARLAGAGSNNSGPSPIHDVPILGATLAGEKTWPRLAGGCEWSCTSRPVTVDYSCRGHHIRASSFLPLPNFMKPLTKAAFASSASLLSSHRAQYTHLPKVFPTHSPRDGRISSRAGPKPTKSSRPEVVRSRLVAGSTSLRHCGLPAAVCVLVDLGGFAKLPIGSCNFPIHTPA
ncbi:hypothetical protein QBC33DRAFT_550908 [Phialemonium atrogriseum]|uniref:Uncharacterized protein n=1 Tax=Phialemonium atrogriseum TaxID=1093897 RepID=A0AAJ0BTR2_9PEZI|nr:uncharacterized protein QBC33DRAFT_550908 [Phialemonium atrogriseum]KAK1762892.1 hypothetical protein QBC33DRAFT_550908 [Phialemonium atrogriseum]